jgi:hypothetical protein
VRNDTRTTPSSASTLHQRHRKRTVIDPRDLFVVMLRFLVMQYFNSVVSGVEPVFYFIFTDSTPSMHHFDAEHLV